MRWNRILAVGLAFTVAGSLAACSSSKSGPSGSHGSASGGTLTYATDTPPDDWDPGDASPADTNLLYYQGPYETLVQTDSTGKVIPGLATKWDLTPTSLTFTLRTGVTFTDGTAFDASAVKANIDYIMKNAIPPNKARFAKVSSIDAVSPTEVKINFSSPAPELLLEMTRFASLMVSPKALQNPDALKKDPVGTGPYILDTSATVPNSQYVYNKNPKYWNPSTQHWNKIIIYYIPDMQARTNALLTGKVDATFLDLPFMQQVKNAGFDTTTEPSFPYYLVIMDRNGTKVPAFKSQDARQALSYAIDRQAFFKTTEYGYGTPSNQWTTKGSFGYNPDYQGATFDVSKAKSLLSQAGYQNGFSFDVPSYGPFDGYNQPLVGFFANIGVKMNLVQGTVGNISGQAASGKFAAALLPAHEIHPMEIYDDFVAKDGKFNPFHVDDPQIDALMSQIKGDDGPADQKIYEQMSKLVAEQGILVNVGTLVGPIAWNPKKVTGIEDARWIDTAGDVHWGLVKPAG